nr:HEAT repeat domain-containing protein [Streptomyces sp. RPA4-2]
MEAALRAGLERTYGPGHPSAVHRYPEDGGITVEVQLLDPAGHPVSGNDQQTGHAAIATLLETSLGIAAPAPELAARALRRADPADDDWTEAATALGLRGDEDTFRAAVLWCRGTDPLRQAFGADVLGRSRAPRSRQVLRELARETGHPVVARAAVAALGRRADPAALPEVLRHAEHPEAAVRAAVADALAGLLAAVPHRGHGTTPRPGRGPRHRGPRTGGTRADGAARGELTDRENALTGGTDRRGDPTRGSARPAEATALPSRTNRPTSRTDRPSSSRAAGSSGLRPRPVSLRGR